MDEFDFEELNNRLKEISATLHQILDEQLRSNIAMENIGPEQVSPTNIFRKLSQWETSQA